MTNEAEKLNETNTAQFEVHLAGETMDQSRCKGVPAWEVPITTLDYDNVTCFGCRNLPRNPRRPAPLPDQTDESDNKIAELERAVINAAIEWSGRFTNSTINTLTSAVHALKAAKAEAEYGTIEYFKKHLILRADTPTGRRLVALGAVKSIITANGDEATQITHIANVLAALTAANGELQ